MLLNEMSKNAKAASARLGATSTEKRNEALFAMAEALKARSAEIISANEIDLNNARANGMSDAMLDRLSLNEARINAISESVKKVIALPDPLSACEEWTRPNGIKITKKRVPFGVIAIIYEARPNVTVDAAVLCLKSSNAVILRGGSEAINSNKALAKIMRDALSACGLNENCVCLKIGRAHV